MEIKKEQIELKEVSKKTFVQRFLNFKNFLIPLFLGFVILTYFAKLYPYFPFDLVITLKIQQIDIPVVNNILLFMTLLGNSPWGTILTLALSILIFLLRGYKDSFFFLISSTGVVALAYLMKIIVQRPRPDPEIINQVGYFIRSDSFPSGHVLFAIGTFGFAFFLAYSYLKNNLTRKFILIFFLVLIILMGLSRIYLGAHWFSDTLGSYLIGTVWLYFIILLYQRNTKTIKN